MLELVLKQILLDLLLVIFHHLYLQQQEKSLENNVWSVHIQQAEQERELFPDANTLNVTSDFIILVVFQIITV